MLAAAPSHPSDAKGLQPHAATRPAALRCHACRVLLRRSDGDDVDAGFCGGCKGTEAAAELAQSMLPPASSTGTTPFSQMVQSASRSGLGATVDGRVVSPLSSPRQFTSADLSLIKKVGRFMPQPQLLKILNDRLRIDAGDSAASFTPEQLQQELARQGAVNAGGGRDWTSLRKRLAIARREGVLATITEQVINDFAIVYQLNAKQVLELKDIVLPASREE
ncbi:hypothetical protein QRD43_20880 [Pelomonas sp. APW6]|uniref:Uncharacterized protein n=1 Tax=Roseateles subflavus TaxID=3053353 RepID=A0ABT7LND2_9BURK|nr:hypothetical protein [Pelomonas sp. APW6]MDL5034370.1 hypothetical protein [Pelomonas sp. APW6]